MSLSVDENNIPLENRKGSLVGSDGHKKPRDFDDVLEIVGSTSNYQRFFLYAILLPLSIFEAFFGFLLWFLVDSPDHWCNVPRNASQEENLDLWKNRTIPREPNGDFSKCKMFGPNDTTISCNAGWEYDFSTVDYHSIVTDYDWVCDKSHYATWVYTAGNIGNVIGTFVLGHLADKIGRKPVFIITLVLFSAGRAVSLFFANDIWMFMLLSMIVSTAAPMFAISCNTIGLELCGQDYRAWIYSVTWMAIAIASPIVPCLTYLVPNWFLLGWVTILMGSLSYVLLPWMPESPRWLLSVGKIDKVQEIMKMVAKWNGTSDKINDEEMLEMLREAEATQLKQKETEGQTVLKLFYNRRMAMRTLIIMFVWAMNGLVTYGLVLNSLNLHGHRYLNFTLGILMEVPGGLFGAYLAEKFGRRWTQVLSFLVCAVACTTGSYYSAMGSADDTFATIAVITSSNIAKFAVTMSFLVIHLQATELFPTPFRTTGSGLASTTSSITLILVPYIVYSGKSSLTTPWIISAVLSYAGTIAAACIPETVNHNLPETLEEAANFGKGRKFWSFYLPKKDDIKK
ncbi:Organic cation transporter 1 [Orchesella cincta]|uniref:Organic cation transporter 1 n=1 Tax=Orchesella cincta TaxID=48709 RepID=A0A1D2M8Z8_ORCCI|nr:Organic cation transporter 1 [Orchesella cincta]